MNNSKKNAIYISFYNDLSKIMKITDKNDPGELYLEIPSPEEYYDFKSKTIKSNVNDDDENMMNNDNNNNNYYSILQLPTDKNNNLHFAKLLKLDSGAIALHIPYIKLFLFGSE